MAVLAIGARVIERLLPYLTRVAKTSPGHWAKLVAELKAKGVTAAESAAGIVAYARANPLNATLVFTTIASLGMSVADLFDSTDKSDVEVRKTAVKLDQLALGIDEQASMQISKAAAASETLHPGIAEREVEVRMLADLCQWARGHFGSARAALEGHQKAQAFFELPYADVEAGFRYLR